MKSSSSRRTTTIPGACSNRTILFLLLLVMGDLGIQTNSKVMAGPLFSKNKGNKTEEESGEDRKISKELNNRKDDIQADIVSRVLDQANSILKCYEIYNNDADTGMNETQHEKLQNKLSSIDDDFTPISELLENIELDRKTKRFYEAVIRNFDKLYDKLNGANVTKETFAKPYEKLQPEKMDIDANSFRSFNWWHSMKPNKKLAIVTSLSAIAGFYGVYLQNKLKNFIKEKHPEKKNEVKKTDTNIEMYELTTRLFNEDNYYNKHKPKSTKSQTSLLSMSIVLVIPLAIGAALVIFLVVYCYRNRSNGSKAMVRPAQSLSKSNKSVGSSSSNVSPTSSNRSSAKDSKSNKKHRK